MDQKIQELKNQVADIKAQKGPRAKIPTQIWEEIAKSAEKHSLSEICQFIGIDANNARIKIKRLRGDKSTAKSDFSDIPQMVQIPSSPAPVMELALNNGTVVRVFSS